MARRRGRQRPANAVSMKFVHVVTVRGPDNRYVLHKDCDSRYAARKLVKRLREEYGETFTITHASFPRRSHRGM